MRISADPLQVRCFMQATYFSGNKLAYNIHSFGRGLGMKRRCLTLIFTNLLFEFLNMCMCSAYFSQYL